MVVLRGAQRVEAAVELTDHLEPYEHPFVGPPAATAIRRRNRESSVRYVYPGSPAAEAGIQAQDRLLALVGKPVNQVAEAWQILANHEPKAKGRSPFSGGPEARSRS